MPSNPNAFEGFIASAIFASRWLLSPFFIGLIIATARSVACGLSVCS